MTKIRPRIFCSEHGTYNNKDEDDDRRNVETMVPHQNADERGSMCRSAPPRIICLPLFLEASNPAAPRPLIKYHFKNCSHQRLKIVCAGVTRKYERRHTSRWLDVPLPCVPLKSISNSFDAGWRGRKRVEPQSVQDYGNGFSNHGVL